MSEEKYEKHLDSMRAIVNKADKADDSWKGDLWELYWSLEEHDNYNQSRY